ncbi:uncharacterized SAM-binding protein YcdF (DUF218 family) [Croceifilum oryzae]|uniref:Uncharacterized SAM-binding protein YcdF (DUF218 family) n=1 Tax=Croceifilum oryzae TaxID=1553429 RepID=A0AAJ1WQY2_9BACL|nr:YdcF family protein [Croceifilum oryzae]MDQ0418002.1 uncharacterized SAM-binding protein YcdF (DUF218 family) [Croceifilum oryzae]
MKTLFFIVGLVIITTILWVILYIKGKRFALRNQLQKSDAIVVLAGTRGNIEFLNSKIYTAVQLYRKGWAPYIICSGKFSAKVDSHYPNLIPLEEIQEAVTNGRIQEKDVGVASTKWDASLGSEYMRHKALNMGIPAEHILIENKSLHTRENAEYVLEVLKENNLSRIILVTSAFHQLRTFLTFSKVFQPHGIEIINYYADEGEWHPNTWFFSKRNRKLVNSETQRIRLYRAKGDL